MKLADDFRGHLLAKRLQKQFLCLSDFLFYATLHQEAFYCKPLDTGVQVVLLSETRRQTAKQKSAKQKASFRLQSGGLYDFTDKTEGLWSELLVDCLKHRLIAVSLKSIPWCQSTALSRDRTDLPLLCYLVVLAEHTDRPG